MQILHRRRRGISIIYCDGTLDREGVAQLEFFLDHSLEYLRGRIVLNTIGITNLDPDCLTVLISRVAKLRNRGCDILLSVMNASDYDVMSDFAVSDVIPEYRSLMSRLPDFPMLEINWSG